MKVLHLMTGGGLGGIQTMISQYAEYSNNNHVFIFTYGDGYYCDLLEGLGKKVYRINDYKGLKMISQTAKIIKQEKPDIIIEHFCAPILRLILLYAKIKNRNLQIYIYQHHDADLDGIAASGIKKKIIKKIDTIACKSVDGIIAISNFVKNSVIKNYNIKSEKIKIIYNGVDLSYFGKDQHKKNEIIYVGRLVEGKGVQLILDALQYVEREFHFNIVGDGPYRKNLEKKVKKLGLQEKVTFCGPQQNISEWMQKAAIFIHMPIFEEGFGITVVEAMAAGLIVITTNSGGIPEIIRNNENGYLIDKDDPIQISKCLEKVLDNYNNDIHRTMRKKAIQDSNNYNIQKFTLDVDTYLNENQY